MQLLAAGFELSGAGDGSIVNRLETESADVDDPDDSGELQPVAVAVETPRHSAVGGLLRYLGEPSLPPGTLVSVPLGRRKVPGLVWDDDGSPGPSTDALRPVEAALRSMPPLSSTWRTLVGFTASYYQRGVGELALAMLPPELRKLDEAQLTRRIASLSREFGQRSGTPGQPFEDRVVGPLLNAEQRAAVELIGQVGGPTLLHGVTGSGKTEVYLHAAQAVLATGRQVLVLVPEINLTPQLEAQFAARFPGRVMVSLHSGLTVAQRLRHWLLAHLGLADLVLGTRLAVFASMPRLGLIVVDEEHDPSFKQQEGARYSARDLAVWRANQLQLPVVLGSATPSLESWQNALQGRYRRVVLAQRIGGGVMPRVRLLDMAALPRSESGERVLAPELLAAIEQRLQRNEQTLLLLNRRGYAPVLHCMACGWKSGCPHCSSWRVFHKLDRTLRCHHCGLVEAVPRACPDCGNLDIAPIGRGTEKLAEQLSQLLPRARVARLDADSTRGAGALEQQLRAMHDGEVDILVGTQMLAKGHDFRRVTLVGAVNPDAALFSSDFRAPERLFALLMQAAGRAGRDADHAAVSEMWIQTWHRRHPLYAALVRHDYEAFATAQLAERRSAGLPPFSSLALLRAEARSSDMALAFLREATELVAAQPGLTIYRPVPPYVSRVADVERLQMLLESPSRLVLQKALAQWLPQLNGLRARHRGVLRWAVDVDPLAI